MKILITGGAGFIGYHLVKQLIERGHEVIIYDAFLNYIDPEKSTYDRYLKMRLEYLKEKTTIIRGDIRHKVTLFNTMRDVQPEVVVHLAALPISTVSNKFSEDAIDINLNGTTNVLESIRMTPSVKKFVYTSSSMVYGNFQKPTADESHTTNPIDVYGATKLSGELLTRAYGKQYDIQYSIIRPSAVYGPTDCNRRVSQIFLENILSGTPITLHNEGESKLDFTYVDDLAQGFRLVVESEKSNGETFNITYGEGRSLKDFVNLLKDLLGKDAEINYKPADMKRPERGSLDVTKAKKLLGYKPENPLEVGLKKYVEFVKTYAKI